MTTFPQAPTFLTFEETAKAVAAHEKNLFLLDLWQGRRKRQEDEARAVETAANLNRQIDELRADLAMAKGRR